MLGPPLRPAHRLEEEPDLGGVLGKVGDGWKMDEQEGHRNSAAHNAARMRRTGNQTIAARRRGPASSETLYSATKN
jgi:hypothetical protein